jgi:phosphoribosylformylglycinamidine cyclo-ligase
VKAQREGVAPTPTSASRGATTYERAGVDIEAKTRLLEHLAPAIASTHDAAVVAGVGAFAGAFRLGAVAPRAAAESGAGAVAEADSLIAATTDGAGTKTLVARRLGRDEVIGADIVAHCANDLVANGARPVAFLDYIAMARLDPAIVTSLVQAMAGACRDLGVVLLGGETAEMPDVYAADAYDVVGTMIGIAPPGGLISGADVRVGDRLIGLASTGLHTNGYSLARRVLDDAGVLLTDPVPELGATAGEALLAPHRSYADALLSLLPKIRPHALAHITGGGLAGNLVRVLPEGCRARVARPWPQPPVFGWLQRLGRISDDEVLKVFNLGVGMVVIVAPGDATDVMYHIEDHHVPAFDIGEIARGVRGVDVA